MHTNPSHAHRTPHTHHTTSTPHTHDPLTRTLLSSHPPHHIHTNPSHAHRTPHTHHPTSTPHTHKPLYTHTPHPHTLTGFTGIDSVYEPPENPDLSINTSEKNIDECVEELVHFLQEKVRDWVEYCRVVLVRDYTDSVCVKRVSVIYYGHVLYIIIIPEMYMCWTSQLTLELMLK